MLKTRFAHPTEPFLTRLPDGAEAAVTPSDVVFALQCAVAALAYDSQNEVPTVRLAASYLFETHQRTSVDLGA